LTNQEWLDLQGFFHGDPACVQTFIARSDEEMVYALRGAKRQAVDRAHGTSRHGPDVTDPKQIRRVTVGTAPDGIHSPTPISTVFDTYEMQEETWNYALKRISVGKSDKGVRVNLNFGPGINGNPMHASYFAIIEHPGHANLAHGFARSGIGIPAGLPSPIAVGPGINRTATRIRWDASLGHWKEIQHIPWGKDFDFSTLRYTVAPDG
jgi:hypothetical protein